VNRGDKAFRMVAFVYKLCPVIPLHKRPQKDMGNDDIIVRAGAVWSGVGTLAVALLGKRATLTPSSPCGRPGGARHAKYTSRQVNLHSFCL